MHKGARELGADPGGEGGDRGAGEDVAEVAQDAGVLLTLDVWMVNLGGGREGSNASSSGRRCKVVSAHVNVGN